MKIIFEGPDNVGKTTQIKLIKDKFNKITFHTVHYSAVKHDSIIDCIDYNIKLYSEFFELLKKYNIIADRSHLGELVYGKLYRGYEGLYVIDLERNHKINEINDLYLIVLIDKPENLIKREDGYSFSTNIEMKKKEIELFKKVYELSTIKNKVLININKKDPEQVHNEILTKLRLK